MFSLHLVAFLWNSHYKASWCYDYAKNKTNLSDSTNFRSGCRWKEGIHWPAQQHKKALKTTGVNQNTTELFPWLWKPTLQWCTGLYSLLRFSNMESVCAINVANSLNKAASLHFNHILAVWFKTQHDDIRKKKKNVSIQKPVELTVQYMHTPVIKHKWKVCYHWFKKKRCKENTGDI